MYYFFKSTKKLYSEILGFLNKPKTPGHCGFPLANLHFELSMDYVPEENMCTTYLRSEELGSQ